MYSPDSDVFIHLRESVASGRVDIKLILANPRTASTLLETSFTQNPEIHAHAHEPFHRSGNSGDAELGYQAMLEALKSQDNIAPQPLNLLVKEISRGLIHTGDHQRFLSLIDSPPILLIRNPLLSAESKIKAVIKGFENRISPSLQNRLTEYISGTTNPRRLSISGAGEWDFQNKLLDQFALAEGYNDWRSMLEETFATQNYHPFHELLADTKLYTPETAGTLEIMRHLEDAGSPFTIVDSTDFRLDPEIILSGLCAIWNLPFQDTMLHWGSTGKRLNIQRPDLAVWFDRVQTSTHIEAPFEVSPSLDDFPDFIAKSLETVEIPAYCRMFSHPSRIKPTQASLQESINVPIANLRSPRLEMTLSKAVENGSVDLSLTVIDPLFFALSTNQYV